MQYFKTVGKDKRDFSFNSDLVQTLEINAEEESCQVDTEFCLEGRMIHTSSKGVMDIFSHYIMSWCDEAVAIIRGEQFTKSLRKTFSKSRYSAGLIERYVESVLEDAAHSNLEGKQTVDKIHGNEGSTQ